MYILPLLQVYFHSLARCEDMHVPTPHSVQFILDIFLDLLDSVVRPGGIVVEESKALGVASGGAANIYINLKGREKAGIVLPEEYPEIQKQILSLFESLIDPATGKHVFQRVLAHDQLSQLGLDHPNSGDVFIQANPGYNLDDWRGWDDVLEPASFYGQHGYDISLPEMQAMFIAAGAGLNPNRAGNQPAEGWVIPPVRVVDYAPTIATLMGFELPASIDGQPIQAFLER